MIGGAGAGVRAGVRAGAELGTTGGAFAGALCLMPGGSTRAEGEALSPSSLGFSGAASTGGLPVPSLPTTPGAVVSAFVWTGCVWAAEAPGTGADEAREGRGTATQSRLTLRAVRAATETNLFDSMNFCGTGLF